MTSDKVKGYALGIVAAATYGMNPLFALPLYEGGMDAGSVLFFRYLLAIPVLGGMLRWRGRGFKVTGKGAVMLWAMGMLMALSSLWLFLSYNYMDAGIASSLLFVYPIMVAVIMSCVFHDKLGWVTVVSIVLALGGIGLLYQGDGNATLSLRGTLMVFASSLAYAIYLVYVSRSGLNHMPTVKVTFYVLLFGWMLFAVYVPLNGGLKLPSSAWLWLNVAALALFPTAVSLLCTTRAIQYIGSTPTAILGALEPVTAVFFGVVVFDEPFTTRIFAGLLLIVAGVTMVIASSTIHRQLLRLRKLWPRVKH